MMQKKIKNNLKKYLSWIIYVLTKFSLDSGRSLDEKNKKLLIIKLDAIGDYVLFRNYLQVIRNSSIYRDYQITLLGNITVKGLAEVLDKDTINKFIWVDRKNIFGLLKVAQYISKRFSVVIHATYSREFVGDLLVKLSDAPERIGFNGDCVNISPSEREKTDRWYTKLVEIDPKISFEFYKNRSFFRQILGEELNIKKPIISVKDKLITIPIVLPENFVLLFPGAQQNFRKWPVDNFRIISAYLIEKYNLNIVICGSSLDKEDANFIKCDNNKIINLAGKTDLSQLAYIISRAKIVVSNDTSGAHIGAALDVSTIVISQLNHYSRFFPYPSEISAKITYLSPQIFNKCLPEELRVKFEYGSNEDISLVTIIDVKQALDEIISRSDLS